MGSPHMHLDVPEQNGYGIAPAQQEKNKRAIKK
jgi:hypothetical protein